MSVVDIGIAVFTLAMAAIGWELGLVRSAMPLFGFIGGAVAGSRIGPELLSGGAESRYAPVITVLVALFAGALLAVLMDGISVRIAERFSPTSVAGRLDGLGGATLLAALAMLIAWAIGAVVLQASSPGNRDVRKAMQDSDLLTALNDVLPPSGPLLHVLRRIDPGPTVQGPNARVPAPDPRILRAPAVAKARASVVKVIGTACGLGLEGSGWSAGGGLIVTNAHVVAGEDDTRVAVPSGDELDATVVDYEPRVDVAILHVDGLSVPALNIAAVRPGTSGAVLGYPENGPFHAAPARLGRTGAVTTQDSYGRGSLKRQVTPFRGRVRSGNSGGPVVDAKGRVATTVFAANASGPKGGLGVADGVVRAALSGQLEPTGTGPCVA